MLESIKHKGKAYEIAAIGLVSPKFRKSHLEQWKDGEKSLGEPPEDQVTICANWLKEFSYPTHTKNKKIGSYALKHIIEKWAGEYVCNGALILAVFRLGNDDIIPDGEMSFAAHFTLLFHPSIYKP